MFRFLGQILSSDTQEGSFSRATGLIVVLALIIWASWITWHTSAIPDIPVYWLTLVLGLYGINKLVEGAQQILPALKAPQAGQPVAGPAGPQGPAGPMGPAGGVQ